jgi:CheY-like chemotaxis protein
VLIVVSDSGSGIRAEDALRIFEPFFSTKPRGKGTGLGLSTSLAILKSHGGFIHFSSEPGQGSTFCVYLPVATDAPQRKDGSAVAPVPRGKGQLILVVDDEESIREITRKTLEASGYKVLLAANGQEALDLFRPQCGQIALVVTDLMMPVMDGIQLMSELRKQYPKTRILATSGLSSQTSLSEQVPGLADRFVAKPYSSPDFLREVHALLG